MYLRPSFLVTACLLPTLLTAIAIEVDLEGRDYVNQSVIDEANAYIADANNHAWYETGSMTLKGMWLSHAFYECTDDQLSKLFIGMEDAVELAKVAYGENNMLQNRRQLHSDAFIKIFGDGWENAVSLS